MTGFIGTFICALTIDHVGRRPYFAVSFAAAAVSLGLLAMQPTPSAEQVLMLCRRRVFLHQHNQHRRLSLHAGALPDADARTGRRHGHGVAPLCLDDRADARSAS